MTRGLRARAAAWACRTVAAKVPAALLIAAAMLAGCQRPEAAPAAPTAPTATTAHSVAATLPTPASDQAEHERGRKIWNFRCYFCHGYSGDARTLAASYLAPRPRDFTDPAAAGLSPEHMRRVIAEGSPGTAMKGFANILQPDEIAAVAAFLTREFIQARAPNTRYHTAANGWPDHDRHAVAFPFARGEIALDTPWEQLDARQQQGKRLFLSACVTCHDHARVRDPGPVWETRALSFPRDVYCTSCHEQPNGEGRRPEGEPPAGHPPVGGDTAGARHAGVVPAERSPRVAATYRLHDTPPRLQRPSPQERRGEAVYQRNCAFCHAADGSAKSWIGRFLEPHPRDLTDPAAMAGMTRERLRSVIEDGLEGSSMPGWKTVLAPPEIDALVAYIHRAFHPVQGM